MSKSNTFETYMKDLRSFFYKQGGCTFSPTVIYLMGKIIAKHKTNNFSFNTQRFFLLLPFHYRRIKEPITEKGNLLDISNDFDKYYTYQASLFKQPHQIV